MKRNLNVSDENLHHSFFTSGVKHSEISRTIRQKRKGIISRKAFRDLDWKYSFTGTTEIQQEIFQQMNWQFLGI